MSPQCLLLSLWLVPRGREKVLIDMQDLKNVLETRTKKKKEKTPKKNETTLYVNTEDEHSVPGCVEQIEFEIVAERGTQAEEVIRHTLSKQYLRKIHLLKKQVKLKNAQIKELKHYKEKIFSNENTKERDLQFLTRVANSQLFMWLLDGIKSNISLIVPHCGYENHLFLVLMKLKLGLMHQYLAIRFNLNEAKVLKIFRKCIKSLPVLFSSKASVHAQIAITHCDVLFRNSW